MINVTSNFNNIDLTLNDVLTALNKIKTNKSTGHSSLNNYFIKQI